MKTTVSVHNEQFGPKGEYQRGWHLIDATGKTLGRLSSEIAKRLMGKHKPIYTPNVDTGDFIVVINAEKIELSGAKLKEKIYYKHTGFPGGLKAATAQSLLDKNPTALVAKAVKGMMPKSKLGRQAIRKLMVYSGSEHPHHANKPQPLDI